MADELITVEAIQMGGVPRLPALRIPVARIMEMAAQGMAERARVEDSPGLVQEESRETLRYASEAVRERELPLNVKG